MDSKIFRKISVERLSSPENLDQVMRVVPARNWMALVCLFAVAAAFAAWAFLGEIALTAEGSGVMLPSDGSGAPGVAVVLSGEDGRAVQAGMEAFVVLDARKGDVMAGRVDAVLAADGALAEEGESIPASALLSRAVRPGDVAALIRFDAGEAAKAEELLQALGPEPAGASPGWPCQAQILVERFRPARLILPD